MQPVSRVVRCVRLPAKLPFGFLFNSFTKAFNSMGLRGLNYTTWAQFRTLFPLPTSLSRSINRCKFLSSSLSLVCWCNPSHQINHHHHHHHANQLSYQQISFYSDWSNGGQRINHEDLEETVNNFWRLYRKYHRSRGKQQQQQQQSQGHDTNSHADHDSTVGVPVNDVINASSLAAAADLDVEDDDRNDESWETIIERKDFQVWRRKMKSNSQLFQYKIYGSFDDIPAKAFFLVQLDTEFRKKWDKLVVKLDQVDQETLPNKSKSKPSPSEADDADIFVRQNESAHYRPAYLSLSALAKDGSLNNLPVSGYDSQNQVIHWIMHYPYPMYKREYCYVRRAWIEPKSKLMVIVAKSVDHPACCTPRGSVRVSNYDSRMVIRPHEGKTFEENGFEYLLTYFDDPQSAFPSAAYNWMAYSGVPDFVKKLHLAAVELNRELKKKTTHASSHKPHSSTINSNDNNSPLNHNSNNSGNNSSTNSNNPGSCKKSDSDADSMTFTYA